LNGFKGKNKMKKINLKSVKMNTWLVIITAIYAAGLIIMNVTTAKILTINNFALVPAASLVTWLVAACNDTITEVWGKRKCFVIFTAAYAMDLLLVLVCLIAIAWPGIDTTGIGAFAALMGINWRFFLAGLAASFVSTYVNNIIMWHMRKHSKNEKSYSRYNARAILSTFVGQLVDDAIFQFGSFAGTLPVTTILQVVAIQTAWETVLEGLNDIAWVSRFTLWLKNRKAEQNYVTEVETDNQ
jgi:uncharacterized integral membrane protein (TIGR00697 family)